MKIKDYLFVIILAVASCNSKELKKEIEMYDNGTIKRVFYVDKIGNRQGKGVLYYKDGTIQEISYFKDDLLNGTFLSYDEDGVLRNKGVYSCGNQIDTSFFYNDKGRLESYVVLNEKSEDLKDVFFYPNGNLKKIRTYFVGTGKINSMKSYEENGNLITDFPSSKFVTINQNNDGSLLFNVYGAQISRPDSIIINVLNDFDSNDNISLSVLRKLKYVNGEQLNFSIIDSDYIDDHVFLQIDVYGMLDGFSHSQSFHVELQEGRQAPKDNLNPIYGRRRGDSVFGR